MITVLGASGFVGSNIVSRLQYEGKEVYAPKRDEDLRGKNLGNVIYCIGMTADFRTKPFETVEAHVCKLASILQHGIFDSFTYLSSTRVYIKSHSENKYLTETDNIVINAADATDIFAASKITGELLALNSGKNNIKIVRLSNVFGADLNSQNFITAIVKDAVTKNKIELFTTPDSAKDYISIEDVCTAIIALAQKSVTGIYNLAYGKNTSNEDILNEIKKITGAAVVYSPKAATIIFQEISTDKIATVIDFKPAKNIIAALPEIIAAHKNINHYNLMLLTLNKADLMDYTSCQLNTIFPDKNKVTLHTISNIVDLALDRLHFCFKHVAYQRYNKDGETQFNHLYADHYLMYTWFLANTIWKEGGDTTIASKLYYLNKTLHALDCMYDTKLPDIFLLFHASGTMLGKAAYADYFVALQGCTIGSQKGDYPVFGKGVALTANSTVIGKCTIGNRCTISTRTTIFQRDMPDDTTAFVNFETGQLQMKPTKQCYAQQFFNVDLNTV